MCNSVRELVASARRVVGGLDSQTLASDYALALAEAFTDLEKIAAAGRTISAGRVSETGAWRSTGATSGSAWLAARAGIPLPQASAAIQTSAKLRELPAVREAFTGGELSLVQATEIAAAAAVDPSAENELLHVAERSSVAELTRRCREVAAAANGDETSSERIRRGRYLHRWNDPDGAVRFNARMAPDDAAPLVAMLESRTEVLRTDAHGAGQHESRAAYAADALVSLAAPWPADVAETAPRELMRPQPGVTKEAGESSKATSAGQSRQRWPLPIVHVRVSGTAFERGYTVAGETCHIEGIGPIPVSAARKLALSGIVRLIGNDETNVTRVVSLGRQIPAVVRAALEARDPVCVVPGCGRRIGLEIDHIVPIAEGGATELSNLARLCKQHHADKTHRGWRLGGEPGAWTWTPPAPTLFTPGAGRNATKSSAASGRNSRRPSGTATMNEKTPSGDKEPPAGRSGGLRQQESGGSPRAP